MRGRVRCGVRLASLALAALSLAGCYTLRFERRGAAPEPGAAREVWHHGLVGGTFDLSGPVRLDELCPAGVSSVEQQVTFANGLISLATSGGGLWVVHAPLWEPTTVRVRCAAPRAWSGKPVTLALLALVPLSGVDEGTARLLGDALAGELRKRPGVRVLSQADVAALLGVERTRQMLGCAESGCLAELGGALGADRIVHGSLGRVGDSLVVNLATLDPKKAVTAASVSERLRGQGAEPFLDALPRLADALLGGSGPGPAFGPLPPAPPK